MCEYCNYNGDNHPKEIIDMPIGKFCGLDVTLEQTLYYDRLSTCFGIGTFGCWAEEKDIVFNYCPMCGRKLNNHGNQSENQ